MNLQKYFHLIFLAGAAVALGGGLNVSFATDISGLYTNKINVDGVYNAADGTIVQIGNLTQETQTAIGAVSSPRTITMNAAGDLSVNVLNTRHNSAVYAKNPTANITFLGSGSGMFSIDNSADPTFTPKYVAAHKMSLIAVDGGNIDVSGFENVNLRGQVRLVTASPANSTGSSIAIKADKEITIWNDYQGNTPAEGQENSAVSLAGNHQSLRLSAEKINLSGYGNYTNTGIYMSGASGLSGSGMTMISDGETRIEVWGGKNNIGIVEQTINHYSQPDLTKGTFLTFTKGLEIKASSDTGNNGGVAWGAQNHRSLLTVEDGLNITAQGGDESSSGYWSAAKTYGINLREGGEMRIRGDSAIRAYDHTRYNTAISVRNENQDTAQEDVSTKLTFSKNENSQGSLSIAAGADKKDSVQAARGVDVQAFYNTEASATFEVPVEMTVSGGTAESFDASDGTKGNIGVSAETKDNGTSKITFADTVKITAPAAYSIGVAATAKDTGKSSITFAGDATINAPIVALADGEGASAVFAKSLYATDQDSLIQTRNGAQIHINSSEAGTVQLRGRTENGGVIRMALNNTNSFWQVTDNSAVSRLLVSNGALLDTATASSAFMTVKTHDFSGGGGIFQPKVNLTTGKTDKLEMDKSDAGVNSLRVASSGTGEVERTEYIVKDGSGTSSWSLAGGDKIDAGAYLYELASGPTDDNSKEWFLRRTNQKAPAGETEAALSGIADNYALWYAQLSNLRNRLGEVRYGARTGLWVRGFVEKDALDGLGGTEFRQDVYGGAIGYDFLAGQDARSSWILGMQARASRADQDVRGLGGTGDLDSLGAGLYATWLHADGWYMDAVATADRYHQNLKSTMLDGTPVKDSSTTYGLGASLEAGRKFSFGFSDDARSYWFAEPQLQLSYFWLKGKDSTASNGMRINRKDADSLTGRAGVVLGKKFALGQSPDDPRYVQPYLKAGVIQEFSGSQAAYLNNVKQTGSLTGARGYFGAGVDWQATDNLRVYAQVEREQGKHFTREASVSAGLKWSF